MQSATRSSRRTGLASPTGRSRNTRPKWLPSFFACSSGRRFTGTVARRVMPSTSSPRSRMYSRNAPAAAAISTSLTVQSQARPTAFTSSSSSGSAQATRLLTPRRPRSSDGGSSGNASAMHQFARDLAALLRQHRRPASGRCTHLHALARTSCRRAACSGRPRRPGARPPRLRCFSQAFGRSLALPGAARGVGQRQQHLHQRDAVGVAVVDARDQRRATVVALDQVELPQRPVLVERAWMRAGRRIASSARFCAAAVAAPGSAAEAHVPVEVEIGVVLPRRAGRRCPPASAGNASRRGSAS